MPGPGRVATLLLAAGGSSRLGEPKQLLMYQGRPLVVHAAETALAAALGPVWVVLGAHAEHVGAVLVSIPVRVHVHASWAEGMGGSIAAGTEAVLADPGGEPAGILVAACDQPGLTPEHLRALAAAWNGGGRDMAASAYAGTQGVPAIFGPDQYGALRTLSGPAGARAVLARAPERVTGLPFPAGEFDVDTPADRARLAGP